MAVTAVTAVADVVDWFGSLGNPFLYTAGMGIGLAIVFAIAGMVLGKTASR